jgi:hypothetical protein
MKKDLIEHIQKMQFASKYNIYDSSDLVKMNEAELQKIATHLSNSSREKSIKESAITEYENNGICKAEALQWKAIDVSAKQAVEWRRAGCDVNKAKQRIAVGLGVETKPRTHKDLTIEEVDKIYEYVDNMQLTDRNDMILELEEKFNLDSDTALMFIEDIEPFQASKKKLNKCASIDSDTKKDLAIDLAAYIKENDIDWNKLENYTNEFVNYLYDIYGLSINKNEIENFVEEFIMDNMDASSNDNEENASATVRTAANNYSFNFDNLSNDLWSKLYYKIKMFEDGVVKFDKHETIVTDKIVNSFIELLGRLGINEYTKRKLMVGEKGE